MARKLFLLGDILSASNSMNAAIVHPAINSYNFSVHIVLIVPNNFRMTSLMCLSMNFREFSCKSKVPQHQDR